MDLKFLMSTCQYCGEAAKGRYYKALLILTPFAIIFYSIIIAVFLYVGLTNPEFDNAVGHIAVFICILFFLAPGLLILFLLKRSKSTCDSCMHRDENEITVPHERAQYIMAQTRSGPAREPRPQLDRSEPDAITELLDSNPSAKEVINRNSVRLPVLTMHLAKKVVQATVFEWANNIEEAAKLYESLGLSDEAVRVRSKNNINMNASDKAKERV